MHSIWHFLGEATEVVTHADSRLWRTLLALLLKPGFLTREFIDGRRVSYLPPIRLYLVLSVVFFLVALATPRAPVIVGAQIGDGGPTRVTVTPLDGTPRAGESEAQREARLCGQIEYHGWWRDRIEATFRTACQHAVADDDHVFREAFLHSLPRAMFLFLPLLAAVMTLLYWRPRHYYVEQLLLLVHNHAFVFLVVILMWLAGRPIPASLAASWPVTLLRLGVGIYALLYVYRSMRRVYGQGWWLTLLKFAAMSLAYFASALLMVVITAIYSALLV